MGSWQRLGQAQIPLADRSPKNGRLKPANVLFLWAENAMTTQKYRESSRHLLSQARSELAIGDVRQASEKGWGAAVQMVKAIAEERGWQHRGHAQLFDAVATIAAETGDDDVDRLFELASAMHTNFYEDRYGAGRVERGLRDIKPFLDKLEPVTRSPLPCETVPAPAGSRAAPCHITG